MDEAMAVVCPLPFKSKNCYMTWQFLIEGSPRYEDRHWRLAKCSKSHCWDGIENWSEEERQTQHFETMQGRFIRCKGKSNNSFYFFLVGRCCYSHVAWDYGGHWPERKCWRKFGFRFGVDRKRQCQYSGKFSNNLRSRRKVRFLPFKLHLPILIDFPS